MEDMSQFLETSETRKFATYLLLKFMGENRICLLFFVIGRKMTPSIAALWETAFPFNTEVPEE